MDKLSWLASESRLHESSDSQEDKYPQSSSPHSTSCAITTSINQNFQLEEEVELNEGGPVFLPVREDSLVADLAHTFDREKDYVDNSPLMERKDVALAQVSLNQVRHSAPVPMKQIEEFILHLRFKSFLDRCLLLFCYLCNYQVFIIIISCKTSTSVINFINSYFRIVWNTFS